MFLREMTNDESRKKVIDELIEKIKALTPIKKFQSIQTDIEAIMESEGFAVRQYSRPLVNSKTMEDLRNAMIAYKKVQFDYPTGKGNRRITLNPYGLIVDFSFLICHNICMKKKALIVTLFGLFNHGNRLQNYALQKLLLRYFDEVYSLMDTSKSSKVYRLATAANASFSYFISKFHSVIGLIKPNYGEILKKYSFFYDFNRRIKFIKCEKIKNNFDYFVTGSDQVWNFTFKLDNDTMFLNFTQSPHKISYAASIGMRELSKEEIEYTSKSLSSFKAISVRENDAKDLIQPLVDKPVEVVLDPTLMLTADEWDKVIKKPKFIKKEKFILQYVLGSDSRLPSTAEWSKICGKNLW